MFVLPAVGNVGLLSEPVSLAKCKLIGLQTHRVSRIFHRFTPSDKRWDLGLLWCSDVSGDRRNRFL